MTQGKAQPTYLLSARESLFLLNVLESSFSCEETTLLQLSYLFINPLTASIQARKRDMTGHRKGMKLTQCFPDTDMLSDTSSTGKSPAPVSLCSLLVSDLEVLTSTWSRS